MPTCRSGYVQFKRHYLTKPSLYVHICHFFDGRAGDSRVKASLTYHIINVHVHVLLNCVCIGGIVIVENCDRILDFSTSAYEDTRFVKLFARYLGLYY